MLRSAALEVGGGKPFAIVHFHDDNSIFAVPVSWIIFEEDTQTARCYFPDKSEKELKKLVKNQQPFEENWPLYQCKILRRYETYQRANANVAPARYDSDWVDVEPKKKPAKAPEVPLFPGTTSAEDVSANGNDAAIENFDFFEPSSLFNLNETAAGNSVGLPDFTGYDLDGFKKDVLTKLQQIQDGQTALAASMETLSRLVMSKMEPAVAADEYKFPSNMFPIKAMGQLDELETLLAESIPASASLVSLLATRGGSSVEEACKLMLKYLMIDELMTEHCYRGQSEKKAFTCYGSIINCMQGAIKKSRHLQGLELGKEFDAGVSKSLKKAVDRVNMRRTRAAAAANPGAGA